MNKTTEALKLAKEALNELRYANDTDIAKTKYYKALDAIREALAEQIPEWVDVDDYEEPVKLAISEEAFNWIDANAPMFVREALAEQAEQEPVCCVADLDVLQRGFILDRGYSLHDALYAAPVEPVKQEPVSYVYVFDGGHTEFEELSVALPKGKHKLYTTPVRTKDLTDDELDIFISEKTMDMRMTLRDFARAVIAADREKNK